MDQQQVRPVRVRSPAGNLGIIRVGVVIQHHASYGAGTVPGEVQRPGRLGAPGVGAGGVNALPPAGPVCTGLQSAADIVVKLLRGIQILLSLSLIHILQLVTDAATVQKYGGARMYFAPAADYDAVMKRVPFGKVLTVGKIREYFARKNGADFTDPITAGIFVSISAWASAQRQTDETPYWRTLKADGELNAKYPGGAEAQRARLEAEGHTRCV